jgi:serine/threonine-protein kinase
MGTVWVARNIALESSVALKLLRADFADEDAGERLLQEARVAARLDHSAIGRVFDFGQTSHGDPFIVMDLLEGETLAALLAARGRVAPVKAVQIVLPVIDALAMAHGRGVVHRDLKPENIFLALEPGRTQPKILDFGIAKSDVGVTKSTLTRPGTAVGSPGYMAPEQANGSRTIDARADIWAVCIVLYECITGRPPFQAENYNALMRAILEDDVIPISEFAAGDSELWVILRRGLQKDPTARWSSAEELGRALAEWLMRHEILVDISGERLSGWIEQDSSKSRDLLSVPPSALGPTDSGRRALSGTPGPTEPPKPASLRPGLQSAVVTLFRANRPQPFRARAPFIAAIALLILAATVAVTVVSRRHTSTIGSNASPLPDTTAPKAFEPTTATTSAPPREPASALIPTEPPERSSAAASAKPRPAARAVPVPQKTKVPENAAPPSDLKDPY